VNPLLGISLKLLSALSFTLMSATIKHVGQEFPTGQIVFFRSFFALVPLIVWLSLRGEFPAAVRTSNAVGHLRRGLIGSGGMFFGFTALALLPLTDAIAIGYAAPLITVVLAAIFLKETVRLYRWTAVAIGFAGVLIMLAPHLGQGIGANVSTSMQATGAIFALLGATCAAGATIEVRRLLERETTGAIVFYFSILTSLFGLATIVLGWRQPTWSEAGLLIMAGMLGGIGQILMTQSFRHADASLIAPFEYASMIFAVVLGIVVFDQWPTLAMLIGGSIVAASGVFVIWRERKLGLARKREAEVSPQRPG
jgi:drug/metabolite transporter (DMT)-like permease